MKNSLLLFLILLPLQIVVACDFTYTPINSNQLQTICFDQYQVGYSQKLRTSLYSSEILDKTDVKQSRLISRIGAFFSQPNTNSPKTSEYVGIGYDRGHLTPSNDMPDEITQRQTFSMVNVTPQYPKLNEHQWRLLEEQVQTLVETYGDAYVMTGIVPSEKFIHSINVPTKFWKILVFKKSGQSCTWIADNDKDLVTLTNIKSIEDLVGLGLKDKPSFNKCPANF